MTGHHRPAFGRTSRAPSTTPTLDEVDGAFNLAADNRLHARREPRIAEHLHYPFLAETRRLKPLPPRFWPAST
jgi:hypothetical protein